MMRFDKKKKKIEHLPSSDLKETEILERKDLQQAIVNCWDVFKKEMQLQSLYFIGQEVAPHDDVANRIDILAYDAEDNVAVDIELKRGKNKLQLLQAISYSAMVSTWSSDSLLELARDSQVPELDDLEDLLKDNKIEPATRIILLAEYFEPEVMISADWLYRQFDLDVMAYGMNVFVRGDEIYFSLAQRYPLAELSDSYAIRVRSPTSRKRSTSNITWDEVAQNLEYAWERDAIQTCLAIREGEPDRRRFGSIRSNWEGFAWVSVNFRRSYVNVYLKGDPENAESLL